MRYYQLSHRQVDRLENIYGKNHLKNWKLKQFARQSLVWVSPHLKSYLIMFMEHRQRTWIYERRIITQHQLLLTAEMSIVDISMESGFSSQSYFTQSYHRRF